MTKNQKAKFLAQCAANADAAKAASDASKASLRKIICDINGLTEGGLIAAKFIADDAGVLTKNNQHDWYANAILSVELLEKKGAIFNAKLAMSHAVEIAKTQKHGVL